MVDELKILRNRIGGIQENIGNLCDEEEELQLQVIEIATKRILTSDKSIQKLCGEEEFEIIYTHDNYLGYVIVYQNNQNVLKTKREKEVKDEEWKTYRRKTTVPKMIKHLKKEGDIRLGYYHLMNLFFPEKSS